MRLASYTRQGDWTVCVRVCLPLYTQAMGQVLTAFRYAGDVFFGASWTREASSTNAATRDLETAQQSSEVASASADNLATGQPRDEPDRQDL